MNPLHFTNAYALNLRTPSKKEREQLEILRRLVVGEAPAASIVLSPKASQDAAVKFFRGQDLQHWEIKDKEAVVYECLIHGAEAVIFKAESAVLLDYTIQSSFERNPPELTNRTWTHDCTGEGCGACLFMS